MATSPLRRYFRHGLFPQMVVFEAVARLGSVTRAAEELHLAQPTVSCQIRKLAETLDLTLFEQKGRSLQLTAAGREVFAACAELRQLFANVDERLAALREEKTELLRLGAAPGARFLAARLLASYCLRHPGVQATLHVAPRAELLARLTAGEDECSLLSAPGAGNLVMHPVSIEALRIYAPRGHAFTAGKVCVATLARHGLILREPGARLRDALLAALAGVAMSPLVRAELSSNAAIAEAISSGLGVGLLPEDEAQGAVRLGAIVPLEVDGFPLYREWSLTRLSRTRLTPVAEAFGHEVGEKRAETPPIRSFAMAAP